MLRDELIRKTVKHRKQHAASADEWVASQESKWISEMEAAATLGKAEAGVDITDHLTTYRKEAIERWAHRNGLRCECDVSPLSIYFTWG